MLGWELDSNTQFLGQKDINLWICWEGRRSIHDIEPRARSKARDDSRLTFLNGKSFHFRFTGRVLEAKSIDTDEPKHSKCCEYLRDKLKEN